MKRSTFSRAISVVATVSLGLLALCSLTDPTDVAISFRDFSDGTATPASAYTVRGTISSDNGINGITISVTGPDGVPLATYNTDGGGQTSYNLAYPLALTASNCNGQYTVSIRAVDAAGNEATTSVRVTLSGARTCTAATPSLTVGTLTVSGSVTPASPATLTASVTCSNCTATPSVAATVKDSAGATASGVTASASYTTAAQVTVSATSAACNGTYTITMIVTSGSLSETRTATVTLSGATDCNAPVPTGDLTIKSGLVLGAQNNSAGSSLDIDTLAVLTSANAKTAAAKVDLIAAQLFASGDSIKLGSPSWANANAVAVADGWSSYNTTLLKPLGTKIDMGSAKKADLKTAWNNGSGAASSVACKTGTQYLVLTSTGALALVEVTAVVPGATGSVTIKVGTTEAGVMTAPTPEQPATLTSTSLSVGADKNATLGSFIDLDIPQVLMSTPAKAAAATIDLFYANSFATDSDKLGSPKWANENVALYPFIAGWSAYNDTKFYKLTGTTFESVTTATQLNSLWNATKATASSIDVVAGDVVIAKTEKGVVVLIKITAQTPGATGKIDIKVAK